MNFMTQRIARSRVFGLEKSLTWPTSFPKPQRFVPQLLHRSVTKLTARRSLRPYAEDLFCLFNEAGRAGTK
jgi:hypothetical protein